MILSGSLDGDFEKMGNFIFSSFVAEIKSVNINEDKAKAEKKETDFFLNIMFSFLLIGRAYF